MSLHKFDFFDIFVHYSMDISDAGASSTDQRMASFSDMNDADDTNDETRSMFHTI